MEKGYLSRKFVLALLCLGAGTYIALQCADVLSGFTALVATILGFYNGANVIQDFVYAKSHSKNSSEEQK